MHMSRNTAHAQWLRKHCQWYPMGYARTHNSRTDRFRNQDLQACWRGWFCDPPYVTTDQGQTVKITQSQRINSNTAITRQRMVVSSLKLMEIFSSWRAKRTTHFLGQYVN